MTVKHYVAGDLVHMWLLSPFLHTGCSYIESGMKSQGRLDLVLALLAKLFLAAVMPDSEVPCVCVQSSYSGIR